MQNNKVKITKKEFDDIYEITGDTQATPLTIAKEDIPSKEDTTPEFLTDEEQEIDNKLFEDLGSEEDSAY